MQACLGFRCAHAGVLEVQVRTHAGMFGVQGARMPGRSRFRCARMEACLGFRYARMQGRSRFRCARMQACLGFRCVHAGELEVQVHACRRVWGLGARIQAQVLGV